MVFFCSFSLEWSFSRSGVKLRKLLYFFRKLQYLMPLSIQLMSTLLRRGLIADGSIIPSREQPRSSCHGTVFAFFLITLFSFLQVGSESGSWLSNHVQISHLYDSKSAQCRMRLLQGFVSRATT